MAVLACNTRNSALIPHLWRTIGDCLNAFTPNECANYFAAAGYDAF